MNAIVKRATNSIKRLWSLVVYAFQSPVQDSHSKRRTAILFSLVLVVHLVVLPAHELGSDIGLRSFAHLNRAICVFVRNAGERSHQFMGSTDTQEDPLQNGTSGGRHSYRDCKPPVVLYPAAADHLKFYRHFVSFRCFWYGSQNSVCGQCVSNRTVAVGVGITVVCDCSKCLASQFRRRNGRPSQGIKQ